MLVFVLFSACGFAQPPEIEWSRTYGGMHSDMCFCLDATSDGGYVMAGVTWSFGSGDGDFWLVKTNPNGDSLWSRTFGGRSWDECYSVQQTTDGGFILGGTELSFGTQRWDAWIVRTAPNGDSLWSRSYGGPGDDAILSICQTPDGGYYACGRATWFDNTSYRAFLMKMDSNGDSIWSRSFEHTRALSVSTTENGDCIVTGYTISAHTGRTVSWLNKTDENGNGLWNRTFEREGSVNYCYSMCQTFDGGFVLGGLFVSDTSGARGGDFWMVKTNANGDSIWSRNLGSSSSYEFCTSVWQTMDGGYILCGYIQTNDTTNADLWVVKTDTFGIAMWSQSFGGEGWDEASAVQQAPDGGYIIGGMTNSFGAGADDFLLIKIAPDMSVPKTPVPQTMCLLTNYPNPFNSTTVLQFAVPHTSRVMIRAYDLLGRNVGIIADAVYGVGSQRIVWDGRNLASGVYWIRMSGDGFNLTRKAILLR
jgi:hypothetical protein